MFGIRYDIWKSVCEMYFTQDNDKLKRYLQWFPFSILTEEDKKYISSVKYYNKFIENGSFILCSAAILRTDNFMQKADASFRNSNLVSPILFLLSQAISKEIEERFEQQRISDISVYYSGNLINMQPFYKESYDYFFKEINIEKQNYNYFIKTDIHDFYRNINLNLMFEKIESVLSKNINQIPQYRLNLYKELLKYCGCGRYPMIENNVGFSYLATVVYLEEIDNEFYKFLMNYVNKSDTLSRFKMIRYVDDLYIMIESDINYISKSDYNEIINALSSIIKKFDLSLNMGKCCMNSIDKIDNALMKSLYDEFVNGIDFEIPDFCESSITSFLEKILDILNYDYLTVKEYNKIIHEVFYIENIEFTPGEVFNFLVYSKQDCFNNKKAEELLLEILKLDISFISFDPRRLTNIILQTESDRVIKLFLKKLFERNKTESWNSCDTAIAINYLLLRKFKNSDLLDIIKKRSGALYIYYTDFCKNSWCMPCCTTKLENFMNVLHNDHKTYYLYLMYLFEMDNKNILAAFAYFKNFFDRVTAHIDFELNKDNVKNDKFKKPNYKGFYKEKHFINFYKGIANIEKIITEAHKIRNENPITHSSSNLLNNGKNSQEIKSNIDELKLVLWSFCELKKII